MVSKSRLRSWNRDTVTPRQTVDFEHMAAIWMVGASVPNRQQLPLWAAAITLDLHARYRRYGTQLHIGSHHAGGTALCFRTVCCGAGVGKSASGKSRAGN